MKIAAVVLTFNAISTGREDLLRQTVASLKASDAAVYIVDNGSRDGTERLFPGTFLNPVPKVTTSGHGTNLCGQVGAGTDADLIVHSDDDMLWPEGWDSELVDWWESIPRDVVLTGCHLEAEYPWNQIRGTIATGTRRGLLRASTGAASWSYRKGDWGRRVGPLQTKEQGHGDVPACVAIWERGLRIAQIDLATHAGAGKSTWGNVTLEKYGDDVAPVRARLASPKAPVARSKPVDWVPGRISLVVPSRGRPDQLWRMWESAQDTADGDIALVGYVDDDDPELKTYQQDFPGIIVGPRVCLSEAWNLAAAEATGEILMHAGDDIIFRTDHWDTLVREAFASYPDKIVFVHGRDGHHDADFGTHGWLHRRWIDTVGTFLPPYFVSDYNDTWLNDVANMLDRRHYLPGVYTEHMHPNFGKGPLDLTHRERLDRHAAERPDLKYNDTEQERVEWASKLRAVMS